jgi:hypothetical protein
VLWREPCHAQCRCRFIPISGSRCRRNEDKDVIPNASGILTSKSNRRARADATSIFEPRHLVCVPVDPESASVLPCAVLTGPSHESDRFWELPPSSALL